MNPTQAAVKASMQSMIVATPMVDDDDTNNPGRTWAL